MNDKFGKKIEPGNHIAYGYSFGSSVSVRIGRVLEVKDGEKPDILAIGVDDDYDFIEKRTTKAFHLKFPERILVLDEIPAEYLAMLQREK